MRFNEDGELRYAGRVGTGYSEARLDEVAAKLRKHARKGAGAASARPTDDDGPFELDRGPICWRGDQLRARSNRIAPSSVSRPAVHRSCTYPDSCDARVSVANGDSIWVSCVVLKVWYR